jgi:hypothetical protein
MSGLSGIWDGAQLEVITTDSLWLGIPYPPGDRHALAVDSRSRKYVIFTGPEDSLYFTHRDPGQPWSRGIALPASPTFLPHAGVVVGGGSDLAQFLYLEGGYYRPSYLVHAIYDFNTSGWATDTIARTTRDYWPSWVRVDIAADTLGGFHVVWAEPAWNEELHAWVDRVMYAENTSGSWRTQVVAAVGVGPLIELDPWGRTLISYHVRRDGHEYTVFAANRWTGDTVWVADSIDTAPAGYGVSDMCFGADGTLHVLLSGQDCYYCEFIHRLFYTRRSPGTRVFEPWHQLFDHADPAAVLMIDCSGRAHAWYRWYDEEEIRSTMYYATNASGTWVTSTFSFGGIPDRQVDGPAMMLDRFDQARAVLTELVDYRKYRFLYYGAPTVYLDVIDVIRAIDHVYGGEALCDPYAYDADCSGAVDAADVIWIINYCFRNGPNGCRF